MDTYDVALKTILDGIVQLFNGPMAEHTIVAVAKELTIKEQRIKELEEDIKQYKQTIEELEGSQKIKEHIIKEFDDTWKIKELECDQKDQKIKQYKQTIEKLKLECQQLTVLSNNLRVEHDELWVHQWETEINALHAKEDASAWREQCNKKARIIQDLMKQLQESLPEQSKPESEPEQSKPEPESEPEPSLPEQSKPEPKKCIRCNHGKCQDDSEYCDNCDEYLKHFPAEVVVQYISDLDFRPFDNYHGVGLVDFSTVDTFMTCKLGATIYEFANRFKKLHGIADDALLYIWKIGVNNTVEGVCHLSTAMATLGEICNYKPIRLFVMTKVGNGDRRDILFVKRWQSDAVHFICPLLVNLDTDRMDHILSPWHIPPLVGVVREIDPTKSIGWWDEQYRWKSGDVLVIGVNSLYNNNRHEEFVQPIPDGPISNNCHHLSLDPKDMSISAPFMLGHCNTVFTVLGKYTNCSIGFAIYLGLDLNYHPVDTSVDVYFKITMISPKSKIISKKFSKTQTLNQKQRDWGWHKFCSKSTIKEYIHPDGKLHMKVELLDDDTNISSEQEKVDLNMG